jgi:UDP-N-acetylmuramyl tripeptide synthase
MSACQYLLLSVQTIVAGIEATEVVPGRTEYIDLQQNFQVLVDSANTPGALNRLLEDVRMCGARKILLVFGCEGDEDKAKRPYMGEIAHYKVSPQLAHNFTSFVPISRGVY